MRLRLFTQKPNLMNLFISYAAADRLWVEQLGQHLRGDKANTVFCDQHLAPIVDWWNAILTAIENADAILYILSPQSVESLYCRAEIGYALERGLLIVPIFLQSCEYPTMLKRRRVQYYRSSETEPLDQVAERIERILEKPQAERRETTRPDPPRPEEPKPLKAAHAAELLALAEVALRAGDNALAIRWCEQVTAADPNDIWGLAPIEFLHKIQMETARTRAYAELRDRIENPATAGDTRAAWETFAEQYPDYDPDSLKTKLPPRTRSKVYDILPQPFEWIDIPAGKVTIAEYGEGWYSGTFEVPAFKIAKYPVTRAQYHVFLNDVMGTTRYRWWIDDYRWWNRPQTWTEKDRHLFEMEDPMADDVPIFDVLWFEAVAFCRWLSDISGEPIMLPTEQQWQRAAQGDDGRVYPWGNKWDGTRCNNNIRSKGIDRPTPVTQYEGPDGQPIGESPFGVVDMAGNLWEWCLNDRLNQTTLFELEVYRVLRGGTFRENVTNVYRCDDRSGAYSAHWRGFRIALNMG